MNMKKWLMDWLLSEQEMRDYAYASLGAPALETKIKAIKEENVHLLSIIDELKNEKDKLLTPAEQEVPKKKRKYNKKKTQE